MKKLLLLLLISLGFMGSVNAEERANLICTLNQSIDYDSAEIKNLKPTDHSLVVFPEEQMYTYDGNLGLYNLKGNLITYTACPGYSSCSDAAMKSDFSVDRTTGVFKEYWYVGGELAIIFMGKCKKSENLF